MSNFIMRPNIQQQIQQFQTQQMNLRPSLSQQQVLRPSIRDQIDQTLRPANITGMPLRKNW